MFKEEQIGGRARMYVR